MSVDHVSLNGVTFTTGDLDSIVEHLRKQTSDHHLGPVRLINLNSLANASRNESYDQLLRRHGVNIIDSTPLAWILSVRHRRAVHATRGPDLFRRMLSHSPTARHFLLGGDPADQTTINQIRAQFPLANIVGAFSPPFRPLDDTERSTQDNLIRAAHPTHIWVGLGGEKQDVEAERLASHLNTLTLGVGAAFDFVGGGVAEAPAWLRHSGFEWLYRLSREPRRLLFRYTAGAWYAMRWLASR